MATKKKKTIGKRLPKPGKIRFTDVLAIPLGEGFWGYVRDAKDASFAILSVSSKDKVLSVNEVIGSSTLDFISYCEPWDEPTWIYIGKWKFDNEDEAWPPPKYRFDILDPKEIVIYHKGRNTYTKCKEDIKGMKEDTGLCMPGDLVIKIRTLLNMPVDRKKIELIAPFSTGWDKENKPGDKQFFPFCIDEIDSEYRLIFAEWNWLREQHGTDSIDGYYLNGYGVEGLIKAIRLHNKLPVECSGINYNSEGDTCLIQFSNSSDAENTAALATTVLENTKSITDMVSFARENGFED